MTNRLTLLRGGSRGFWLSRAGIDVLTADDNDENFLISPNFKLHQIFQSGFVAVPKSSDVDVHWAATLLSPPLVVFQASIDSGMARVPFFYEDFKGSEYNLSVTPSTTGAVFENDSNAFNIYVQYLALTRSM